MSVFLSCEREKTIPETVKGTYFFFVQNRDAPKTERRISRVFLGLPVRPAAREQWPMQQHTHRSPSFPVPKRMRKHQTKRSCGNTPAGTKRNDHHESTRASPSKGTPVRSVNRSNPIAIPGSRSGRDAPHFDPLMPHPAKTNKTSAVSIKKVPFR